MKKTSFHLTKWSQAIGFSWEIYFYYAFKAVKANFIASGKDIASSKDHFQERWKLSCHLVYNLY